MTPDADLRISSHATNWLWTVFSLMIVADLAVLFWSLRQPRNFLFHWLAGHHQLICLTSPRHRCFSGSLELHALLPQGLFLVSLFLNGSVTLQAAAITCPHISHHIRANHICMRRCSPPMHANPTKVVSLPSTPAVEASSTAFAVAAKPSPATSAALATASTAVTANSASVNGFLSGFQTDQEIWYETGISFRRQAHLMWQHPSVVPSSPHRT